MQLTDFLRSIFFVMGLAFASSGVWWWSASASSNPGTQHEPVTLMGRTAYVYKPAVAKSDNHTQRAAIFVLHGSGGVAADMFGKGFDELAETNGFLVVYPEMETPRSDEWGYRRELPYFSALVKRLQENDFDMDPLKVSVCGHSAGGTFALFLQNEADLFSAAGAVEAAVGKLDEWDMSKPGRPTMVVWNHADPVLEHYAPAGGEPAYYNLTVSTLRRHGTKTFKTQGMPTSKAIPFAQILDYPHDKAPELRMLSFKSDPGTHAWADTSWCTFSATQELIKFFLHAHDSDVTV